MKKTILILLAMFLPVYLLAKTTFEESYKKIIPVKDKTGIEIRNTNGRVEISSWDRDEVEIIAYKKVQGEDKEKSRRYLSDIEIEIDDDEGMIEVDVDFPDKKEKSGGFFSWIFGNGGMNASVAFEVKVPRTFDLNIRSTNGSVSVADCRGHIRLKTVNGKITAQNVAGTLNAKSTNGKIKVYMTDVDPDEDMSLQTTNGSITLSLPADIRAEVEARTTNGRISCDFPLDKEGSATKHRLDGYINGGGALLYLKTLNGNISILKNEAE
ncbi:MAG TPA: hypothetical protein ENK44_11030 [Caldithrix abyssi]|uniref:DUF4097 domain-containing protein n=1 Tax=Caldithrix abyssi TaxID=187145 RepID=A0A7V4U3K9_CALAY|nr:hypothetical protein [Caldithrix abyssi]